MQTVTRVESTARVRITLGDPGLAPLLIPQGSVAVDGVSLTVAALAGTTFEVMLIPHTLSATATDNVGINIGRPAGAGILDRYPNVKWGFMEGGVAWFLLCLERFDRSWETHIQHDPRKRFLELRPKEKVSEYIARHVDGGRIFVGCEGEEPDIAHAIRRVGNQPFVYSSDFPHEVNNEFCKKEIHEILENEELTAEDEAAVLCRNAQRFYNLRPVGL